MSYEYSVRIRFSKGKLVDYNFVSDTILTDVWNELDAIVSKEFGKYIDVIWWDFNEVKI